MAATLLRSAQLNAASATSTSKRARWAGRILSGIAVLFLTFDTVIKLVASKQAVEGTVQLGWPAHHLPTLGVIELVCLVLYLVPRTAPIGALLWTGYLGGASPRTCGSTTRSSRTSSSRRTSPRCCGAASTCATHAFAR